MSANPEPISDVAGVVSISPRKRKWLPRNEPVSHEQTEEAALRLIHSHFGTKPHARMSIPVQLTDDDITIMDYIEQQAGRE